jgi:hypothetical protein
VRRFIAAVLFGSLVALAPMGTAFAEATTTTTITRVPFGFTPLLNPCTGETLDITGTTQILTVTTVDATGAAHTEFHFTTQGVVGVSQETGVTYQLVDAVNIATYDGPLPAVGTALSTFRLVGPGPGNDRVLVFQLHFTINAAGEPTAFVFNQVDECR